MNNLIENLVNIVLGIIIFAVTMWLSTIEPIDDLSLLDILLFLFCIIIFVVVIKLKLDDDIERKEHSKIFEKIQDENNILSDEQVIKQGGILSQREQDEIKKQVKSDNIRLFGLIILTLGLVILISKAIAYFIFSDDDISSVMIIAPILICIISFILKKL